MIANAFANLPINEHLAKLQSDINHSDRKLVERLSKHSKTKTALQPIVEESKRIHTRKSKSPTKKTSSLNELSESRNSIHITNNESIQRNQYVKDDINFGYEIKPEGQILSSNTFGDNKENVFDADNLEDAKQAQRLKVEKSLNDHLYANQQSEKEIRGILKKIFMFYASFGDRLNADAIKSNKIYKLLHDSMVLEETSLDKQSLDLLFCRYSKNRNSINFDTFLSMMIRIAQMKFPETDPKRAFLKLFKMHFKPLFGNLYSETDLGDFDILFKEPMNSELVNILNNVKGTFSKIHQSYFSHEYQVGGRDNSSQTLLKHKKEAHLFSFLKDFDICPSLLTKSTAFALHLDIIDTPLDKLTHNSNVTLEVMPDSGFEFTLSRFLTYIARLAILGYCPDNFSRCNQKFVKLRNQDKLLLLLERMEFSLGFVNFEKQFNATHNHSTTLLPSKAFLKQVSHLTLLHCSYTTLNRPARISGTRVRRENTAGEPPLEHPALSQRSANA